MTRNKENTKILIVDDHDFIHDILERMFLRSGYTSIHAGNGKEALELIESAKPDLVIMDQMMPVMDGLTATKKIRKKYPPNILPIIFFTAKTDKTTLVNVLNAGANDFIAKPFEKEELIARISAHLRVKTLQARLETKTTQLEEATDKINELNDELVAANRQLRKRLYDLKNLFEVSIKFLSELNYEDVVNTSLLTILGLFGVKFVGLALKKENEEGYVVNTIKGLEENENLMLNIDREDEFLTYIFNKRAPININDKDIRLKSSGLKKMKKLKIEVVAPLIYKNELIGLLFLGSSIHKDIINGSFYELLGILANLISVALLNANLYNKVKAMSYKDGMTGLHNYRFFEMRLKEEVLRANRNSSELHLLIMDVDFFKNYNDSLGHLAGDEVLRILGNILLSSVRQNDVACRYGGEEFAVILPEITRESAVKVAQRLRKTIEKHPFPDEYVQPGKRITVSIGLASVPQDAGEPKLLIKKADDALYEAKETGRNKLVVYSDNITSQRE